MLHGYCRGITWILEWCSRVFKGCDKGAAKVLQLCYIGVTCVTYVLHGLINGFTGF